LRMSRYRQCSILPGSPTEPAVLLANAHAHRPGRAARAPVRVERVVRCAVNLRDRMNHGSLYDLVRPQ
jgi:hypothetical protein